jgi:hypothetical protein
MAIVREILYFDKADRANTDEVMEPVMKRIKDLGIKSAMIVWSSGYTLDKFREVTKKAKLKLNIVTVTNAKGAKMPIVIRPEDKEEVRKRKQEQLDQGIIGNPISVPDELRKEYEKEDIKVYYVPDYLNFGEPLALLSDSELRRKKLSPFMIYTDLRPLDIDAGIDLSLLTIVSQGLRVCIGCSTLAVQNGLIRDGETIVALGGRATALVLQAGATAKTCFVKEIIAYERNSSWVERGGSIGP